jgi:capsular polysaccharide transport system ATP-binding protein
LTTPRQLAHRLATLYRADGQEVTRFVELFADLSAAMDVPTRRLSRRNLQRLNLALFYGLPCDFYLFDETFQGRRSVRGPDLAEVFRKRQEEAGTVLATSSPRTARQFGGTGAILMQRKLVVFKNLEHAIAAYEQLAKDHPVVHGRSPQRMSLLPRRSQG